MEKKRDFKIILLIVLIIFFLISSIAFVLVIFSLNKPPQTPITEQNVTTPNVILGIKSAQIILGNKTIDINITRTGKGDLIQISFIFIDINGNSFYYNETNSNILPKGDETKNYKITSDMVNGLKDFSKVRSVLISYDVKASGETQTVYSTRVKLGFITPPQTRPVSPSGGGGGGGDGGGTIPCNPQCSGKQCGDNGCAGSCGTCSSGYNCNSSGQCISSEIDNNLKLMSKYSSKEAFLISDKNWKEVLPLVPLTTWTGSESCQKGYGTPNDVCVYPTLIWHEENVVTLLQVSASDFEVIAPPDFLYNIILNSIQLSIGENLSVRINITYTGSTSSNNKSCIFLIEQNVFLSLTSDGEACSYNALYPGQSEIVQFNFTFLGTNSSFDADSIIYFLQQYSPTKVTVVGQTPTELDNLLIAQPQLGAGLNINQVQKITSNDYFSYWSNYSSIVYVEDNYELALLASSYASLINSPLVIQNTGSDVGNIYIGKDVICIGNVVPAGSSCKESYDLEQLQQKYVQMSNTDKIILVNPNDLNIKVTEEFQLEKSANPIYEIYSKTSLASPILASAKKELILSSHHYYSRDVMNFLTSSIGRLSIAPNYLTILSSPIAIDEEDNQTFGSTDESYYINYNLDGVGLRELAIGRIYSLTISDDTSYLARDLFYNVIPQSTKFSMLYKESGFLWDKVESKEIEKFLTAAGYENKSIHTDEIEGELNASRDLPDRKYIFYYDHGWPEGWDGITSQTIRQEQIWLTPSLIYNQACLTCSFDRGGYSSKQNLFCANLLRRGAVGVVGAIHTVFPSDGFGRMIINNLFYNNSIGYSFGKSIGSYSPDFTLIGDPTFNFNEDYHPSHEAIIRHNLTNSSFELNLTLPDVQIANCRILNNRTYCTGLKETSEDYLVVASNSQNVILYKNMSICGYHAENYFGYSSPIYLPEDSFIEPDSIKIVSEPLNYFGKYSLSIDLNPCYQLSNYLGVDIIDYQMCAAYQIFDETPRQCDYNNANVGLLCYVSILRGEQGKNYMDLACNQFNFYQNPLVTFPKINYYLNFSIINLTQDVRCKDMTKPGNCSYNGRYCNSQGQIIYNCSSCPCSMGSCQSDGRCV